MDYVIDFGLLALIYFLFFYTRWRSRSRNEFIVNTLMYVYVAMVLFVTLMPFSIPTGATNLKFLEAANLKPFKDFILNYQGAKRDIVLNVIMMMPFGFLYPIIKNKGIVRTVMSTFLFSLTIESSQLLTVWLAGLQSRNFDVTDLITNTFGGLIGYVIYNVLRPVVDELLEE